MPSGRHYHLPGARPGKNPDVRARPALLALAALLPAAHAQDTPAPDADATADVQEAREDQYFDAWDDLYDLRLGKDARWADDTIQDGSHRPTQDGVMVPITSGKKVLEERPVGAVFFGEGGSRSASRKGRGTFFANHMLLLAR